MAGWGANGGFVVGAVNIDIAIPSVGVVLFHSMEPKNTGLDEVFRILLGPDLTGSDPAFENHARRSSIAYLFPDLELADGGLIAARLMANAEGGGGDGKGSQQLAFVSQFHALGGEVDLDQPP